MHATDQRGDRRPHLLRYDDRVLATTVRLFERSEASVRVGAERAFNQ
jgi:hypothetical protein